MTDVATETGWHEAGCSRECRIAHTRKWSGCAHAEKPAHDTGRLYRYVQFIAADGDPAWGFEPVPAAEYRMLTHPKPVLVLDGRDRSQDHLFETQWHAEFLDWARSQGIDPGDVSRIEVYDGDTPHAWVLLYDVNDAGTKYLIPGTEDYAKHVETVPLSSLPLLPESTP